MTSSHNIVSHCKCILVVPLVCSTVHYHRGQWLLSGKFGQLLIQSRGFMYLIKNIIMLLWELCPSTLNIKVIRRLKLRRIENSPFKDPSTH